MNSIKKVTNPLEIITEKVKWQNTLDSIGHYDFYHTYDYHHLSKRNEEKAILIKYTEGNIIICFPLLIREIKGSEYFDATSVYGYAGPLQKNLNSKFNNSLFVYKLKQYFKKEKIISVFSRLNPFIEGQEYTLKGIGKIINLGNVVNIDLTKTLDEQRVIFSKTTKRYLNKGRKLLDTKFSTNKDDIKVFIELYYENMDRVNAKKMYYFKEDYFHKFINSDSFNTEILFAINKETDEIISAAMMIKTNNIIQYHISGTKNNYLNLSPMRLLIDEMRIKGTKEKYTYFNLGGGLGNEEDELFRFKSSFSKDFKNFKIWKYIVNKEVYHELVKTEKLNYNSDFFPLYRINEK